MTINHNLGRIKARQGGITAALLTDGLLRLAWSKGGVEGGGNRTEHPSLIDLLDGGK